MKFKEQRKHLKKVKKQARQEAKATQRASQKDIMNTAAYRQQRLEIHP